MEKSTISPGAMEQNGSEDRRCSHERKSSTPRPLRSGHGLAVHDPVHISPTDQEKLSSLRPQHQRDLGPEDYTQKIAHGTAAGAEFHVPPLRGEEIVRFEVPQDLGRRGCEVADIEPPSFGEGHGRRSRSSPSVLRRHRGRDGGFAPQDPGVDVGCADVGARGAG